MAKVIGDIRAVPKYVCIQGGRNVSSMKIKFILDKKWKTRYTQSLCEAIGHSERKIAVVLFILPQETMFSIEP